jgi:hypothetical protein
VTVLAEFNAFHGVGIAFAVWAVIVSVLGMRREDFPPSEGAQRAVIVITTLLLAGTIGAAIATSEKHEAHGEHETKGSTHGDRANPTQEGEPAENKPNE